MTSKSTAKKALLKKFGRRWSRGKSRKVRCSKINSAVYECRASWRSGTRRLTYRVMVSVIEGKLTTVIRRG